MARQKQQRQQQLVLLSVTMGAWIVRLLPIVTMVIAFTPELTFYHRISSSSPSNKPCSPASVVQVRLSNEDNDIAVDDYIVDDTPSGIDNDVSSPLPSSSSSSSASSLRSVTFSNVRKDQEPQLLCNMLMELGACSTSIIDANKGTTNEQAIFHEFHPIDESSMTRTAVTTHVWNTCHVSAHFPASTSLEWIMEIIHDTFPDLPTYSHVGDVDDEKDWMLHVQKSWEPIVLPPFILRFPWHSDDIVQRAIQQQAESDVATLEDYVQLELQGGIAFGTGEHPTTKLCLDFVSRHVKPGMLLMDYGSGSGVLGIAACKLDSTITAIGVDIDVDAVQIANQNAQMNNVSMKNYLSNLVQTQGDDESTSLLLKAYSSNSKLQQQADEENNSTDRTNTGYIYGAQILPDEWSGPVYDACVANILAGPLVMLGPTIAGLLRQGSHLGLSGIMASQSDMILNDPLYQRCFDQIKVEKQLDGWVLVTGIRNDKSI